MAGPIRLKFERYIAVRISGEMTYGEGKLLEALLWGLSGEIPQGTWDVSNDRCLELKAVVPENAVAVLAAYGNAYFPSRLV